MRLVLASANPDKVAEIAAVLARRLEWSCVPRPAEVPDVVEDGRHAARQRPPQSAGAGGGHRAGGRGRRHRAGGRRRSAGAPGRLLGPLRRGGRHLRRQRGQAAVRAGGLARPGRRRRARFRTVALVAFPDGDELWAEGVVEGPIAHRAAGDGGFGYDPVFVPAEGGGRTFAEMSPGGEARHFAPGPGLPRPGGRAGRQPPSRAEPSLEGCSEGSRRSDAAGASCAAHEGVHRPGGEQEFPGGRTRPLHGEERMVRGVEHRPSPVKNP